MRKAQTKSAAARGQMHSTWTPSAFAPFPTGTKRPVLNGVGFQSTDQWTCPQQPGSSMLTLPAPCVSKGFPGLRQGKSAGAISKAGTETISANLRCFAVSLHGQRISGSFLGVDLCIISIESKLLAPARGRCRRSQTLSSSLVAWDTLAQGHIPSLRQFTLITF